MNCEQPNIMNKKKFKMASTISDAKNISEYTQRIFIVELKNSTSENEYHINIHINIQVYTNEIVVVFLEESYRISDQLV